MTDTTRVPEIPEQRPLRKRLGLLSMIPLIAGVVALDLLALEWRASLKLERLIIGGTQTIPAKEIFSLAKVPQGTLLYDIDLAEIQERIQSQPFIRFAGISRQ